MDRLQSMQVFRRVVELASFAAAGRDQRLSTASVSKHVAALEASLKTKLLHRTTRQVSTTAAGAAYYDHCIRVLEDIERTEQSLGRAAAVPSGLLRVSAPLSFGMLHLTKLLPELMASYPELVLDVAYTDRFIDLVEERVDVAIRIARSLPDSATLVAQRLGRATHVLCASPGYVAEHGAPRSPAELPKHSCILFSGSSTRERWAFSGSRGAAEVDIDARLTLSNSLAIRDAVLAGLGIALIPSFYVMDELVEGKLVPLLRNYEAPGITVHAVFPQSKNQSPKVRVFVEYLRSHFARARWAAPPIA